VTISSGRPLEPITSKKKKKKRSMTQALHGDTHVIIATKEAEAGGPPLTGQPKVNILTSKTKIKQKGGVWLKC
jgi:hypothetical protein